jgi:hypothetical protein
MNALRELQRQLRRLVVDADETPAPILRGASRPEVYRYAYRARLRSALAENYPMLQRALGHDRFAALASRYVDAHPPTQASIRWFGHRLPDFVRANAAQLHPALADLAQMEWALRAAFDAADAATLQPGQLAALPAERWAGLRLVPHPSVQCLPLLWAVEPTWRALGESDGEADGGEAPEPEASPHTLLVWRRDLETRWRSLAPLEAALLVDLAAGRDFGSLCLRCEAAPSTQPAATVAAAQLARWVADGLIAGFVAPRDGCNEPCVEPTGQPASVAANESTSQPFHS